MIPALKSSLLVWNTVDKFGPLVMDRLLSKKQHHAYLDLLVGSLRQRNVFHPYNFYEDGWGDPLCFNDFSQAWFDALHSPTWSPQKIDIHFGHKFDLAPQVSAQECVFRTVTTDTSYLLPKECEMARFLLITPANTTVLTTKKIGPTVLLLAGKGEHSFTRRCTIAIPLAQRSGISSIVLENAFYGQRRPRNQPGSKLRQVSDLAMLGKTTIEEASSLLRYFLLDHELSSSMCVAGASMGGLHAGMTASVFPASLGVVSWLGPPSAVPVFTEGLLSQYCEWSKLGEDGKERMKQVLSFSNIDNFPKPVDPTRAIFVVATQDMFVPFEQSKLWWTRQDQWKGAKFVDIHRGHVSGIVFESERMRRCIEKVLNLRQDDPFQDDVTVTL